MKEEKGRYKYGIIHEEIPSEHIGKEIKDIKLHKDL